MSAPGVNTARERGVCPGKQCITRDRLLGMPHSRAQQSAAGRKGGPKGAATLHSRYASQTKEWGRKGAVVLQERHAEKLSEWGKKGMAAMREKHSDKLSEWAKLSPGTGRFQHWPKEKLQQARVTREILRGLGK